MIEGFRMITKRKNLIALQIKYAGLIIEFTQQRKNINFVSKRFDIFCKISYVSLWTVCPMPIELKSKYFQLMILTMGVLNNNLKQNKIN